MSRKNRPNKQPKKLGPQPAPVAVPPPQPVTMGNVFIQFVREASSLLDELGQRRALDNDIGEYLKEKNQVDDFNAWRTARHAPPATK